MTGFEYFLAVTSTILSLGMLILVSVALMAVFEIRRLRERSHALLKRAEQDLQPFLIRAREVANDAGIITSTLAKDVTRISETVAAATDTADDAIVATRRRLNELAAVLDVVQDEAERLFVSTASTVHGIQRGAAIFRKRGMKFADELDATEPSDRFDTQLDPQEDGDGHDDDSEPTPQTPAVGPRIRSRNGRRRRA